MLRLYIFLDPFIRFWLILEIDDNLVSDFENMQVAFPHLEYLYIHGVDNVKRIWDDQLPQESFSKLKVVEVESCGGLFNIFPSCVLTRSQSLQNLIVRDWISLKEIIAKDINGVLLETAPTFVFPKLTFLQLYKLLELRSLYPGAHTSQWPLLENLQVLECHKLNVFSFETPTFEQRHHEGSLHMSIFLIHHVSFLFLNLITSSCFLIKFTSLVTFSPPYLSPLNFLILKFVLILYALFGTRKVKRKKHREDNKEEKWKERKFGGK